MTVGELKNLLENYPNHYEVLISLHGQDDIFVTCSGTVSGKFLAFPEEYFESCQGELVNSPQRNAVGIFRKSFQK